MQPRFEHGDCTILVMLRRFERTRGELIPSVPLEYLLVPVLKKIVIGSLLLLSGGLVFKVFLVLGRWGL